MDRFLRYGIFALLFIFHTASVRSDSGPKIRYLYNDDTTEETVAFFYDNSFARCAECNPYSQSDIDALRSTPFDTRMGNIYKVADNKICINAAECFPLPLKIPKESPWKIIDYRWVADTPDYQLDNNKLPAAQKQEITQASLITARFQLDPSVSEEDGNETSADHAYYVAQTMESLEKYKLQIVDTEKRYLVFPLDNGLKITVDMQKGNDGLPIDSLLYRPGHVPIIIDLTDSELVAARFYLSGH
ncbi:hypothetical protein OGV94_17990 [Citrobacter sp. Ce006]|uniref:hypothetical protein n=1 Tax=Citrobacter TaxID=544 RepID=UPI0005378EF5|nr:MULTISPECIES: hypothetical protein [Citrobacter]AUT97786.1 hypothetical protein MC47_021940 [Citrobacter freundii]MDM3320162.1 hypothetical protein [Citrobacter sp. Ce006]ROW38357.1 hypothetical protein C3454_03075 [Citrobacter europaeus]